MMIPIEPGIGLWKPRPRGAQRMLVDVPPDLVTSLKLLAFVREETMGNAIGRTIRRFLDDTVRDAHASGFLIPSDEGGDLPLERWPILVQAALLVPAKLRWRVQPDGRVPATYVYGDRPKGIRRVQVPVSAEERVTASICALGQLSSATRWGADVLRNELRQLLEGAELWTMTPAQQVAALMPNEQAAWRSALIILETDQSSRAIRAVPRAPAQNPGADLRIPSIGNLFEDEPGA